MSMSRDTQREVCEFIVQNSVSLFGRKYLDCRLVLPVTVQSAAGKADKGDLRFFVISKFRVFLLTGKSAGNLKIERSFNILALRHLQVVAGGEQQEDTLNVGWEERQQRTQHQHSIFIKGVLAEPDATRVALKILAALKHYFPDIRPSLSKLIQLTPPSLHTLFSQLSNSTPDLPCHNFRRSYVALCDFLETPFRDEVLWDIERIYFTNDIHELRLDDFNHLGVKDQVAILSCAQFSAYFTGIIADGGSKLAPELLETVLAVVRRSHALKSLRLLNCQLPKEFSTQLAEAIHQNEEGLPLETLDLSGNNLDDKKAMGRLAQALARLKTLRALVFGDCSLSEKSTHHIAYQLYNGLGVGKHKFEPRTLILAKNPLSKEYQEANNELINFISLCQSLRLLDLSQSGFPIDKLWSALKLGGLQLETLRLGGCHLSQHSLKKGSKEEGTKTVRELFQAMINLKELDLNGTALSADVLQQLLVGLANNQRLKELQLNLDSTCTADKGCASVMADHIAHSPVAFLSLRDNAMEQDALKVLSSVGRMKSLKCLDIGGSNFQALKNNPKKHATLLNRILQEITTLISDENSMLEELSLSDCHLGSQLSVVLNAVGVTRVKSLDLSGNEMGNYGARLLAKALQLNNSLCVLALDRNQITGEGLVELAHALRLNRSIVTLPYPVLDVSDSLQRPDRQRMLAAMADIEMYLGRNRGRNNEQSVGRSCAQQLCHRLIGDSHRYNINSDNEKKIVFYELQKCLLEMGRDKELPTGLLNRVDESISQVFNDRLNAMVEESAGELHSRLHASLVERGVELVEGVSSENGQRHGSNSADLRQLFTEELKCRTTRYVSESAWSKLESNVIGLLSASHSFKLTSGPLCALPIENSFHSNVRQRNCDHRDESGGSGHRPNSILEDSFHRHFGAVSLVSGETLSSADEEQVRIASLPKGSKLVHLAKSRPPPARRVRQLMADGQANPTSPSRLHSDSCDSMAKSNGDATESPQKAVRVDVSETVVPSPTPPPLAPRRRGTAGAPQLPPKPDSPPQQQSVGNADGKQQHDGAA